MNKYIDKYRTVIIMVNDIIFFTIFFYSQTKLYARYRSNLIHCYIILNWICWSIINYNNDLYVFIYSFIPLYIYLFVHKALPMIPLSQVKVSYMPRFYRSPLKHFFSYYYSIFKLNLFQYDTSLSNNFCDIIDQSG